MISHTKADRHTYFQMPSVGIMNFNEHNNDKVFKNRLTCTLDYVEDPENDDAKFCC